MESGGKISSSCMYASGVCVYLCLCLCACAWMLFVPVISVHARVYRTILSSESMGLSAPSLLTGLLLIMFLSNVVCCAYIPAYNVMPYARLVIASPPLPSPLLPSLPYLFSPLLPSPPLPLLPLPLPPLPPGVHLRLWHVHLCAGRSAVAQPAGTDAGHPRPLRVLHLRSVPQTGPLTSTGMWEEGGEWRRREIVMSREGV